MCVRRQNPGDRARPVRSDLPADIPVRHLRKLGDLIEIGCDQNQALGRPALLDTEDAGHGRCIVWQATNAVNGLGRVSDDATGVNDARGSRDVYERN
jgi:hypothetical protein